MELKVRAIAAVTAITLMGAGLGGCTRHVTINSNPQGARVWVNGQEIGVTPAHTQMDYTAFTTYEVVLQKEGYEVCRSGLQSEVILPNLLFGVVCCWPALLWMQGPVTNQTFLLTPATGGHAAGAPAPVAAATPPPLQPGEEPARTGAFGYAYTNVAVGIPAANASRFFTAMEASAKTLGLVSSRWPDRLQVGTKEKDWLIYAVDGDAIDLTIHANGNGLTAGALQKKQRDLRDLHDVLLADAMKRAEAAKAFE